MDDKMRQMVVGITSQVFETMFFTFLEPMAGLPANGPGATDGIYIRSMVSLKANGSGEVILYLPSPLARDLTLNFLGLEDLAVTPQQVVDTAKETVNMVAGGLLGVLDPEGRCILGIPEAQELESLREESRLEDRQRICGFASQIGPVFVFVSLKPDFAD